MDLKGKVKRRLSIPETNTEFDADIADYVSDAVNMLYPIIHRELVPETVTLAKDSNTIDLSTLAGNVKAVRYIEIYDATNSVYNAYDDFVQHGDTLYINYDWDEAKTVKVFGLGAYTESTVPTEFASVVVNWAMSEFYSNLVGNSRKYNLYTQNSGARKADNMRDLSDYYWVRGNQLLVDRAKIEGAS